MQIYRVFLCVTSGIYNEEKECCLSTAYAGDSIDGNLGGIGKNWEDLRRLGN